jgi:hypothetical protein
MVIIDGKGWLLGDDYDIPQWMMDAESLPDWLMEGTGAVF